MPLMFQLEQWAGFAHIFMACTAIRPCFRNADRTILQNSSGSSTNYGTCHRCCQSEGRRGEDYDCHQPGRLVRGRRSEYIAHRLRSAVECHQRTGPRQGSGPGFDLPPAAGSGLERRSAGDHRSGTAMADPIPQEPDRRQPGTGRSGAARVSTEGSASHRCAIASSTS